MIASNTSIFNLFTLVNNRALTCLLFKLYSSMGCRSPVKRSKGFYNHPSGNLFEEHPIRANPQPVKNLSSGDAFMLTASTIVRNHLLCPNNHAFLLDGEQLK
jgi:hypothetical protein